jgi:hypothetical protein
MDKVEHLAVRAWMPVFLVIGQGIERREGLNEC